MAERSIVLPLVTDILQLSLTYSKIYFPFSNVIIFRFCIYIQLQIPFLKLNPFVEIPFGDFGKENVKYHN